MNYHQTKIYTESIDTIARLHELGLDLDGLLKTRDSALGSSANVVSRYYPKTTPGTYAYHDGTATLREYYSKRGWDLKDEGGIASIFHPVSRIKVAFTNADMCCDTLRGPKPRSQKGSGSEYAGRDNLPLFDVLPDFYKRGDVQSNILYYLAMDPHGAVELVLPVIENGTFERYVERIFLSDGSDIDTYFEPLKEANVSTEFDPIVARKA